MDINLKSIIPHIIAVVVAVALSAFYFSPQLSGKTTNSGDSRAYVAKSKELKDYTEKTGDVSLWAGSLFSGMPSYQVSVRKNTNSFRYLNDVAHLFIPRPIGNYIFGILIFYLSMILIGVNPWVSLLGAVGFAFNTYIMVVYDAGHFNKVRSVMTMMPIIAGLILTLRKKYFYGAVLFSIGLAWNIYNFHIQMTYYLGMILGVFVIAMLIKAIKEKTTTSFFKAMGYLVIGSILALATNASKLMTTMEYAEETMRGEPVLAASSDKPATSSETKGLEWSYAMSYSNGWMDVVAAYIPGVVGGSSMEPVGNKSASAKEFKKFGQRIESAPLYWGSMGSTSGPAYFGAIMIFLFVLSFFVLDWYYTLGFGIAILLSILVSLGSNMEGINRLFYDYLPYFNKFRAHSSIMTVLGLIVAFLGTMGLSKIVQQKDKETLLKPLYISGGILAVVSLFFAFAGGSFFDFEGAADGRYAQMGLNADVFVDDRISLMRSDALRSLFFVVLACGALYLYLKEKIKLNVLLPVLIVLTVVDLFGVDKRYLNNSDFVSKRKIEKQFVATAADKQILKDKDPYFRVINQTVNTFNDNSTSYFHKSIGGYHPAKLQRYQDLIDRHLKKNNMNVYNMLNTKYFIVSDKKKQPQAKLNPDAMGNAWFVNSIKQVNTANEEIDALNTIDVKTEAVVHTEFSDKLSGIEVPQNSSIALLEYKPNHLSYTSKNDKTSLAVFSEIWYAPEKGWTALIDGKETDLIRANYALRAMKIPAGEHKIEMIFDPQSFRIGNIITLISSTLLLLLGGWVVFKEVTKKD